ITQTVSPRSYTGWSPRQSVAVAPVASHSEPVPADSNALSQPRDSVLAGPSSRVRWGFVNPYAGSANSTTTGRWSLARRAAGESIRGYRGTVIGGSTTTASGRCPVAGYVAVSSLPAASTSPSASVRHAPPPEVSLRSPAKITGASRSLSAF